MDIILYTLRTLSYIITTPSMLVMLVILSTLFYFKNRKIVAMQKMIIGEGLETPLELTLSQLVLGIIVGIIASIIFTSLGIVFNEESGIQFLFLLSIILMLIKPRFVCFSYSAAILGIISIVISIINNIWHKEITIFNMDIMCLMTFVGVMHIIEGFLVMFDGEKGTIPVFTQRNNKILGGYALNRYWIIPVAIFLAVALNSGNDVVTESVNTPSWWPLLKTQNIVTIIETSILSALTCFGVVGYSSVSFTRRKKEKAISSGVYILTYGVLLTLVSQLTRVGLIGEIIVVVLAPVGHEFMLIMQRKKEEKREYIFVSDDTGIAILEVVSFSELYEKGVRPGDKIIRINGEKIASEKEVYEKARFNKGNVNLEIICIDGQIKQIHLEEEAVRGIRALLVPRVVQNDKIVSLDKRKFTDVLHGLSKKNE